MDYFKGKKITIIGLGLLGGAVNDADDAIFNGGEADVGLVD